MENNGFSRKKNPRFWKNLLFPIITSQEYLSYHLSIIGSLNLIHICSGLFFHIVVIITRRPPVFFVFLCIVCSGFPIWLHDLIPAVCVFKRSFKKRFQNSHVMAWALGKFPCQYSVSPEVISSPSFDF